jgi:licheninase
MGAHLVRTICAAVAMLTLASAAPALASSAMDEHCPTTAADRLGWGTPDRADDFNGASSLDVWTLYGGPGYKGNGRLTPTAVTLADAALTITGHANGDTEGMAWMPGQLYGRWEVCVKSPAGSPNYHSVALLYPDSNNAPGYDGEIDFMEIWDPTRQVTFGNVHDHVSGTQPGDDIPDHRVSTDATQWHSWAVEWTPDHVAGFVDGNQWFETTPADRRIPAVPMHLCLQVDDFGGDISRGGQLNAAWARQYPLIAD